MREMEGKTRVETGKEDGKGAGRGMAAVIGRGGRTTDTMAAWKSAAAARRGMAAALPGLGQGEVAASAAGAAAALGRAFPSYRT